MLIPIQLAVRLFRYFLFGFHQFYERSFFFNFKILENNRYFKMEAISSDPDSTLNYSILKEERYKLDGKYEVVSNNFFYQVGVRNGLVQLRLSAHSLESFLSILVSVQIQDVSFLSDPIECNNIKRVRLYVYYVNILIC